MKWPEHFVLIVIYLYGWLQSPNATPEPWIINFLKWHLMGGNACPSHPCFFHIQAGWCLLCPDLSLLPLQFVSTHCHLCSAYSLQADFSLFIWSKPSEEIIHISIFKIYSPSHVGVIPEEIVSAVNVNNPDVIHLTWFCFLVSPRDYTFFFQLSLLCVPFNLILLKNIYF